MKQETGSRYKALQTPSHKKRNQSRINVSGIEILRFLDAMIT